MLCGGAGTRFWPASRRERPKPFVPLIGRETLFEATLLRLHRLAPPGRTWVVSGRALASVTRAALRSHPGVRLLLEPQPRNTAAPVLWAAARIAAEDPRAIVGIFPADHHIPEPARFVRTIEIAARAAASGRALVLIGIEPTRPDTGYGYLRVDTSRARGAVPVQRFIEKPARPHARRFQRSGRYLWNAGMVVARVDRLLAEGRTHAPEVWRALGTKLERLAAGRRVSARELATAFRRIRPISFDHAVLERSRCVLAVRGRFRWTDLGSWETIGTHLPRRGTNRVRGEDPPVLLDAEGNVIWHTTHRTLALLGVRDLIVVETPDALLICARDRAQEVRRVVEALERERRRNLT
ncbi:MAG: mannose-1-phosphate guanylyltransferase [Myxococcota bacterium]